MSYTREELVVREQTRAATLRYKKFFGVDAVRAEFKMLGIDENLRGLSVKLMIALTCRLDRIVREGVGDREYASWQIKPRFAYLPTSAIELDPLLKLRESCDDSDDAQYGTLSTSFVRGLLDQALGNWPPAMPMPGESS